VQLAFTIPGPFVSGNHAKTRDGRRTSASREFDERVASIARGAAAAQGWKMPGYVRALYVLVGLGIDFDNAIKEINDPLQGIVYPHDSRISDIRVVIIRGYKAEAEARLSFRPTDKRRYIVKKGRALIVPAFLDDLSGEQALPDLPGEG
jgi:hypothetical protein